ncbi:MAG: tyrosine-type recombinase/integrase, partial [Pseudanabaena sp. M151S2SP2A07QC]|nr:tyrosine-type recombinase/integrase [Pseudanabaena sp. M151S2SP2A07QC]
DTKALVHIRGKKGSNDRLIPLTEAMMTGLSQIKQQKKPFMKTDRWLRMVLLQRFKVKKKLHSLRHTMAVNLYKQTKDIHLVKTALGHRNIANTMIYLDFVEGEEQLKVMRSLYQKKTE